MQFSLYLFTAILYIFSFPNFISYKAGIPWLAWISLVPFIIAIDREKDLLSVIKGSLVCGWIIFLGGMIWLTEVTWIGYVTLTFYMALYIVLFGIICFYFKGFFIIPLAWTVLEFIRGQLGGGIPWLLLGSSQYKYLPLIQITNITGVYGISFIVAMVNSKIIRRPQVFKGWLLIVCILGVVVFYGNNKVKEPVTDKKVRIGIVQPNIPLSIKWDSQYTNWMIDRLISLSEEIIPCDILLWPETAIPKLSESVNIQKQLREKTKEWNTALIVGSQGTDEGRDYYNSAFCITKDGLLEKEYRKIHLVPFGEYVPFGEKIPFLKKLTPIQGGFKKGKDYTIFNVNETNLAVLICFEDVVPILARRFVSKGANLLVNITNDAWFNKSAGPYQHAFLSVFRAAENNIPLIRATNTGVSCFINNHGKIVETIHDYSNNELLIKGYAVKDVSIGTNKTFYTKYGDVFSFGCVVLLICLIGFKLFIIKKQGGTNVR